jgi:hypothetical protein
MEGSQLLLYECLKGVILSADAAMRLACISGRASAQRGWHGVVVLQAQAGACSGCGAGQQQMQDSACSVRAKHVISVGMHARNVGGGKRACHGRGTFAVAAHPQQRTWMNRSLSSSSQLRADVAASATCSPQDLLVELLLLPPLRSTCARAMRRWAPQAGGSCVPRVFGGAWRAHTAVRSAWGSWVRPVMQIMDVINPSNRFHPNTCSWSPSQTRLTAKV